MAKMILAPNFRIKKSVNGLRKIANMNPKEIDHPILVKSYPRSLTI